MKFPRFEHHTAETVEHAIALLSQYGDEAKILAGGQSLFPMMALRMSRYEHLIDIGRVSVSDRTISESSDGSTTISLACRHSTAEFSAHLADRQPLISAAVPWIGHRAIRSRGTICGSIAHGDPAAELPAVALALDATMTLAGPGGTRKVAAADFFLGTYETATQPDEVLVSINFPEMGPRSGWAFEEVCRRHGDYALAGVALAIRCSVVSPHTIENAAVAMFSVGSVPQRFPDAERILVGIAPAQEAIDQTAETIATMIEPHDDLHGTAEYRRHLTRVLVRRNLALAFERAGFDTLLGNRTRRDLDDAHR